MKLIDIISEDGVRKIKSDEELKKELLNSPNTSGLTFDNTNFKYDTQQKRYVITNYSCKIHPTWFKNEWVRFNSVILGKTGCSLCGKQKRAELQNLKRNTDEELKQKLENNPTTSGLTFNNVEFKREVSPTTNWSVSYIKNYSCKLHPTWFQNKWVTYNSVMRGNTGCFECGLDRTDKMKQSDSVIKQLESSPYTSGLTFNNVEIDRKETNNGKFVIKIKNYSCKKHKWWKQNDWINYKSVEVGDTGCKICGIEKLDKSKGVMHDTWDGKWDDDENSLYNKWIKKRNQLLQNSWLKMSRKQHLDPKTKKPKYGYDKVDFNDPSTIKFVYDPITNKVKRRERYFEIFCPKPGHGYFIQGAYYHKKGDGCPICRESRGEIYLANLFSNNDIKYVRGKDARFQGLIGKKVGLICDFYLPDKKVIVEYDGEQHFRPSFGSTEKNRMNSYTITYTNDNKRDDFAKTNKEGISLIRISYKMTDEEINIQLFSALRKIGPNQVIRLPLGEYPNRKKPQSILAKNQVDIKQPIQKPNRTNESKLSLIGLLN
jgi:very-short-patch-repair endonuclease